MSSSWSSSAPAATSHQIEDVQCKSCGQQFTWVCYSGFKGCPPTICSSCREKGLGVYQTKGAK